MSDRTGQERQFYTVEALAEETDISERTIYRLCKSGEIRETGFEPVKIGRSLRLRRITIDTPQRQQHWSDLASLAGRFVAYSEDSDLECPEDWFAIKNLLMHLQAEYPDEFGKFRMPIQFFKAFFLREIPDSVIYKLRLIAARRIFQGTCEVCH